MSVNFGARQSGAATQSFYLLAALSRATSSKALRCKSCCSIALARFIFGVAAIGALLSGPSVRAQDLADGNSSATVPNQSLGAPVTRGNGTSWLDGALIGTGDGATLVPLGTAVAELLIKPLMPRFNESVT